MFLSHIYHIYVITQSTFNILCYDELCCLTFANKPKCNDGRLRQQKGYALVLLLKCVCAWSWIDVRVLLRVRTLQIVSALFVKCQRFAAKFGKTDGF